MLRDIETLDDVRSLRSMLDTHLFATVAERIITITKANHTLTEDQRLDNGFIYYDMHTELEQSHDTLYTILIR